MPKCLIDADVLAYQCGFAGQFKDELTGEILMRDFDSVEENLDMKIREILEETMSDEPPVLYLTGDDKLAKMISRRERLLGNPPVVFDENFRIATGRTAPYKGNRKSAKPLHFNNIRMYMLNHYDCVVSNGVEADDMMATHQTDDTIICSVDKDLRQVPGKHYTWSVGERPSTDVYQVDKLGLMMLKGDKVYATGFFQFFYQVLVGDTVDNIKGLDKVGPKKAYKLLEGATSEVELYQRVRQAYLEKHPEDGLEKLREVIDLVWMIREWEDNKPVLYKEPE